MIADYFTESVTIKRKNRTKVYGVIKETLTDIETVLVAIDKATTSSIYENDKGSFDYTDIIFAPIETDVLEDDIISYGTKNYDVISVINPMKRNHHLEILARVKI